MMFATDRDLLAYEPRLFQDIAWAGQKLVEGTGASLASDGQTLTLAGAGFDTRVVGEGNVVVLGATPLEVLERASGTQLVVSKLRASVEDEGIPSPVVSGQALLVTSFRPQIRLVHEQLLRAIGIEPGEPASAVDRAVEGDITNPRAFVAAEALGALHLIFASAAAMLGPGGGVESPVAVKARVYAQRFGGARRALVAEIDLDGDGAPDAARRANVIQLVRW